MPSSSSIGKLFMFIIDFKAAFRFYAFIMLEFSFSDFKSGAFFFLFGFFFPFCFKVYPTINQDILFVLFL
ncbi:hypothetical protein OIU77_013763, partial [Salix suchowensis]